MSWPMVALGEVAAIERFSVLPEAIADGSTYVGLEHISSGGTDVTPTLVETGDLLSNKFAFDKETILYGKLRPYLGKIVAPSFSGICSTDILPIRPGARIDRKFLLHFLRTPNQIANASNRATGINLPRLSPRELEATEIPLPPLAEQRRISGILDAADTLRRLSRETLALLDTLPGAILEEMFGEVANLPSVAFSRVIHDIGNGVSPSRHGTIEDEVLTLAAVTGFAFDASKRKKDKFSAAIPEGKRVVIGDFLLCRGNGNPDLVGAGKLADETGQGFVYPDTIIRTKLDESQVAPLFVSKIWQHQYIRDQIKAGANTTNGTMKVNQTTVKAIRLPLPSLELQNEFARRASAIESGIKRAQVAHLAHLDTLFATLQSRAFAGDL